ncbi:hypothetical protein llg_25600 [Luteolibacter sp. LG18]|nr:hypothetical protein llg_25600 [Luteolibacter sp. LG18]
METVIAIGVLAVLLTAFLAVFGPATAGIRRAISAQEADRLSSALEKELATLRPNETYSGASGSKGTAFDKAFDWIKNGADSNTKPLQGTILIYQYRADPTKMREDGTLSAYASASSGIAGSDYVIQSGVRRREDSKNPKNKEYLQEDLKALEGRVFAIRTTQLVYQSGGGLGLGTPGTIKDPKPGGSGGGDSASYPEAVIAFSAEFYGIPSTAYQYITGSGFEKSTLKNPIFTRNLAARR